VETTTENDVEATDSITDREIAVVNEAGYTQTYAPEEEDYWTSLVLPDEPLRAGDVITYWSPIFVCGHPEGGRTTTVLEVVPQRRSPLVLDNDEVLDKTQQVRQLKVITNDGLVDYLEG
jgi:hypothetical protein